jgi:hypothetical protein
MDSQANKWRRSCFMATRGGVLAIVLLTEVILGQRIIITHFSQGDGDTE